MRPATIGLAADYQLPAVGRRHKADDRQRPIFFLFF